jgi:hypothetical protein
MSDYKTCGSLPSSRWQNASTVRALERDAGHRTTPEMRM